MQTYCFLNDRCIPLTEAYITPNDLGILRGYGIYEGIASFNGVPFHFHDHFERFIASAKEIGITLHIDEATAYAGLCNLLEKNSLTETRANIRMVATGGDTTDGIEHDPSQGTFYFLADAWTPFSSKQLTNGAKLITHIFERYLPEYKTIHYIEAVRLQPKRKAANAIEILYISNNNSVLECATSNVFIVKDSVLITSKDDILKGITRKVVLEQAHACNTPIEERSFTQEELFAADEVFITSSFKDIMPITHIDDKTIADGTVGPVTKKLMKCFAEEIANIEKE